MVKISVCVGDRTIEIDATINEARRFLTHLEKVVSGEAQSQRRFVFRGNDEGQTRTLVMDLKSVQWAMLVEESEKLPEENA